MELKGITFHMHGWNQLGLTETLRLIKAKKVVEVGVYNAEFSKRLYKTLPGIQLILVDPYKKYDDPSITDTQAIHNARYKMVKLLVEQMNEHQEDGRAVELWRMPSLEAAKLFPNNSIDFVYLDANHKFEYVAPDIEAWWPKIRRGGILAGHDLFLGGNWGVNLAVREFAQREDIINNSDGVVHYAHLADVWFFIKSRKEQKSDTEN